MGILEVKNLTLSLGNRKILDGVDIDFWQGHVHAIVGPNGAGKSTLANTLNASAADARGHVDSKEIVQDQATASAVPVVNVSHPRAHVTHEAAIGSVDSKQLETLMARGLSEDEAVDLIIEGMLS